MICSRKGARSCTGHMEGLHQLWSVGSSIHPCEHRVVRSQAFGSMSPFCTWVVMLLCLADPAHSSPIRCMPHAFPDSEEMGCFDSTAVPASFRAQNMPQILHPLIAPLWPRRSVDHAQGVWDHPNPRPLGQSFEGHLHSLTLVLHVLVLINGAVLAFGKGYSFVACCGVHQWLIRSMSVPLSFAGTSLTLMLGRSGPFPVRPTLTSAHRVWQLFQVSRRSIANGYCRRDLTFW